MQELYHIHRNDNYDTLWATGSELLIDDNFYTKFYKDILKEDKVLIKRYGNYDIDYIIAMMEEIKFKNIIEGQTLEDFNKLLNRYYILRREYALEEGRKIYNPIAPSRLHSIFLTDEIDLEYWKNIVGLNSYKLFLLELKGNLFISSDIYFPDSKLMYDLQVEKSKKYWQPKELTYRKEYTFQGKAKIIK